MENNLTYEQLTPGKAYIMVHDDDSSQQDLCLYKGFNVHILNLDRVTVINNRAVSYSEGSGIFINEYIHVHFNEFPLEKYNEIVDKFKSLGTYVCEKIKDTE